MRTCFAKALILTAAALCMSHVSAQMSTPGQFGVSPSGAATYSIPIQVPPGVAGMQPKLSLEYNSQGGNGILGLGWSLSGLSAITRCPKTIATDGIRGSVNYNQEDRFCLDGQRLMVVNGAYGAESSEYRTEIETFSKIVANGQISEFVPLPRALGFEGPAVMVLRNFGPQSFVVQSKSGLRMEFGGTVDSQIQAVGRNVIRVWALNKITDASGNNISFTYFKESGQHYIDTVRYSTVEIRMLRELRSDVRQTYRGGGSITTSRRITEISTYIDGQANAIKQYRLLYSNDQATQSRITSIQECASSNNCLYPTTFQWGTSTSALTKYGFLSSIGMGATWTIVSNHGTLRAANVGGRGAPGLCGRTALGIECISGNRGTDDLRSNYAHSPNTWTTQYSDAFGWGSDPKYYSTIQFVDINSDQSADVCGRAAGGIYCAINSLVNGNGNLEFGNGTKFWSTDFSDAQGWGADHKYYSTIQFVDVNGDGRIDICGRASSGIQCALNNGLSFDTATLWTAGGAFGDAAGWGVDRKYYSTIRYVDLNGDGLLDVCGRLSTGLYCALNTGTQFGVPILWTSDTTFSDIAGWGGKEAYTKITYIDINGDGLPDVCGRNSGGIHCALNTGTNFAAASVWTTGFGADWSEEQYYSTIQFGDMNADGLIDVCGRGSDGIYCALNTGSNFAALTKWSSSFGGIGWSEAQYYSTIRMMDINGDGLMDMCGRNSYGYYCAYRSYTPSASLLSSVYEGPSNSKRIDFTYTGPQGWYVEGDKSIIYPQASLYSHPRPVVNSVAIQIGQITPIITGYSFNNPVIEHTSPLYPGSGRGYLGYKTRSQSTSFGTTRVTISTVWPTLGLPILEQEQARYTSRIINTVGSADVSYIGQSSSISLSEKLTSYTSTVGSTSSTTFIHPSTVTVVTRDVNGLERSTVETQFSYQPSAYDASDGTQYGDTSSITTITSLGGVEQGRAITTHQYWPAQTQNGNWILGRLKRAQVTSSKN